MSQPKTLEAKVIYRSNHSQLAMISIMKFGGIWERLGLEVSRMDLEHRAIPAEEQLLDGQCNMIFGCHITPHGGYTTSDGVQMVMEPGDLLTQPNWTWHDHNNFSNEPMIWLDGLDAKLVQYLDANFHENWAEDATQPLIRSSEETQQRLTAVRSPSYKPPGRRMPYRYKWADTLRSLEAEVTTGNADPYDGYILEYTDPLSGGHTFVTMS